MKHIHTFESFLNESLNESWPFEGKRHISPEEEAELFNLLKKKKTSILDYKERTKDPISLKDKRFQTDNEEKAWELFEIWASACTMDDLRRFLQEFSSTPHDDIFDRAKEREMGALGTEYMLDMLRTRGRVDVNILKKLGFLI